MKKLAPYSGFFDVFKIIKKHPFQFSSICLLDLFFILVFFLVQWMSARSIIFHISGVVDFLNANSASTVNLFSQPEVQNALGIITNIVLGFLVIVTLLWLVFNSVSWWMSFRINKKKVSYFAYLVSFALITIVSCTLVVGSVYLLFNAWINAIQNYATPSAWYYVLVAVASLVVLYFSSILFARTGTLKEIFGSVYTIGIKNAKHVLLMYLIILILLVIWWLIGLIFYLINPIAGGLYTILLLPVIFAYLRVYIIRIIGKI